MSGYKIKAESTINGSEVFDCSVAKTQQRIIYYAKDYEPFFVLKNILKNFTQKKELDEYRKSINENQDYFNYKNNEWIEKSSIETPTILKPLTKHLYRSPAYRAVLNLSNGIKNPIKRIALVDVFKKAGMTLRSSKTLDEPHGNFVNAILEQMSADIKDCEIEKYNVIPLKDKPCCFNPKSLLKNLKKVKQGNYDYLNLSVYYPHDYVLNGQPISPKDLYKYREELLKQIPKTKLHIIEEIEEIIKNGCEVYIAAGNKDTKFNILSLAKGAHVIGGNDSSLCKKFSDNIMVERYKNLPVYIGAKPEVVDNKVKIKYSFERDITKLSRKELVKRIAKKEDYEELKNVIDKLHTKTNCKFDLNFLQYKVAFNLREQTRGKIFEIDKFIEIIGSNLEKDVLDNINIQGTHCDIQMSQFFDMNNRKNFILPKTKTHNIYKSISGTSYATPQGLVEDLKLDTEVQELLVRNEELYELLKKYIFNM